MFEWQWKIRTCPNSADRTGCCRDGRRPDTKHLIGVAGEGLEATTEGQLRGLTVSTCGSGLRSSKPGLAILPT